MYKLQDRFPTQGKYQNQKKTNGEEKQLEETWILNIGLLLAMS